MAKLTLKLSPETEARLDELKKEFGSESQAEMIRRMIAQQMILAEARSSKLPIIATVDGLEIYNAAAPELQASGKHLPIEALQSALEKERLAKAGPKAPAWIKRYWNALELKPGFLGIRFDLKKALGWEEWK